MDNPTDILTVKLTRLQRDALLNLAVNKYERARTLHDEALTRIGRAAFLNEMQMWNDTAWELENARTYVKEALDE